MTRKKPPWIPPRAHGLGWLIADEPRWDNAADDAAAGTTVADADGEAQLCSPPQTPTFPMGEPAAPLDKALDVAAELEDEELIRRTEP